ncbi:solute carrier family 15 member 1-like [Paramacrobiotus metropolitanus]|uniref:solute carrier family 15 member 1-like n=1 Tax=Paramacrobiotus metropolitanus TaxID=2943436 RepID=UPI0024460C62|nr:solute carrier family 15 member 1-like [Paramacrobiotus metropolitanus]
MSKEKKDMQVDSHPAGEKAALALDQHMKISPSGKLGDVETAAVVPEKHPYPWYIIFILGNEFCERFSYYGMKAVLTIYFVDIMLWSEDTSTLIYHLFSVLCYFTPVFGAMLADGFLGKFNTIFSLSLVYVAGLVLLTLASVPPVNLDLMAGTAAGLILIGLGTGGIKPVVPAYGGDQFKPGQEKQREMFFSVFYFCINAGSLISTFLTPILRSDVSCFDKEGCYPLAFGLPAALMVVALLAFAAGRPFYRNVPSKVNIIAKVFAVCFHAGMKKFRSRGGRGPSKKHWLDHAEDKYERDFIKDVKQLLPVLKMFLPLPMFWALFDQQGSRWTLQATKMDGRVTDNFYWKPDQVQIFNPVMILILIPIFEGCVFRILDKYNVPFKALARMTGGMVLAGVAFVIAGVVQMELDKTLPTLVPVNRAELQMYNTLDCGLIVNGNFTGGNMTDMVIPARGGFAFASTKEAVGPEIKLPPNTTMAPYAFTIQVSPNTTCNGITFNHPVPFTLNLNETRVHSVLIGQHDKTFSFQHLVIDEKVKPKEGRVFAQFVLPFAFNTPSGGGHVILINNDVAIGKKGHRYELNFNRGSGMFGPYQTPLVNVSQELDQGKYEVWYPDQSDPKGTRKLNYIMELANGAVYTIVLRDDKTLAANEVPWTVHTIVASSTLSIFLQLPQYFVMTVGEVLFSVSGLSFAYSQSPASMKSVLQAGWLMTVAFGNVIVLIISGAKLITDQASEFFLFAGLIGAFAILFAVMCRYYKYVDTDKKDDDMMQVKEKEETDTM